MSIIYKALQKTQKNREKDVYFSPEPPTSGPRTNWLQIAVIILSTLLAAIVAAVLYTHVKTYLATAVAVKPQPISQVDETAFKAKHTLNGVFTSDNTRVAMIDNKYFHVGDKIDGMQIIRISDNDVKLKYNDQVFILQIPI